MNIVLAAVSGIMIYISLDELLPAAREYGENHIEMYGLVVGMAIMALSVILMM
jgi:ZIP family zinc transporter